MQLPEILTAAEVARLYRVNPATVARWATTGKLPSFRTRGGQLRFRRDDVLSDGVVDPERTAEVTAGVAS